MIKNIRKIGLLCLLITLTFGFTSKIVWAGFGISPPYVFNDHLTKGAHYEEKIVLVRGDPIEDWQAEIKIDVPKAQEWFSVDKGTSFILPTGEKQVPIIVRVDVPKNADYGEYKGKISIRTTSLKPPEGGIVSIALGAQVDVDIKVTKAGFFDFLIRSVKVLDLEQGFKNLVGRFIPSHIQFMMQLENKGNAKGAPTKVSMDIYDTSEQNLLETTHAYKIEKVAPYETKWITAYLPTKLLAGSYWANYKIYKGTDIANEGKVHLSILPKNNLQAASLSTLFYSNPEIWIPLIIIIIGLIIFFIPRSIKKKRKNRSRKLMV